MQTFAHVMVAGLGVLGSQIAFQVAYSGFEVSGYDVDANALEAGLHRLAQLRDRYSRRSDPADRKRAEHALERIELSSDLATAARDADLVIEAVPENLELKRDFYHKLAPLLSSTAAIVTNTSTLLPSDLAESTGRPDKFLALHFANHIWVHNTAEVMATTETDPDLYRKIVTFAQEIGMVPIELKKEQPGYLLNSLLVPWLQAASSLFMQGIADPEMIDLTWRKATGAPTGPFQVFDVIGIRTAYAVSTAGDSTQQEFANYLKTNLLDQGKLGIESGEGFYHYPHQQAIEINDAGALEDANDHAPS
ncbi:3-hydroxyacyl-CoA dehydrogenase [Ferrimicrobium acidiphilum]|uniref:3-hydroxyacyl-CoA dehydrogenase n=1 Tax=Ferrimicrobium acidiphilum TaxID=121039 RepID=UPI0023F1C501|nr:3-hydroxyacyl-CoA dehydrogenase [Ferrimicrobium acidiphilum]